MMGFQDMVEAARPVSERLAPVLLHSLWQAGLAAGALWVGLRLAPAGRPGLRYGMSLCAMAVVLACVAGTWAWEGAGSPAAGGAVMGPAAAVVKKAAVKFNFEPGNGAENSSAPGALVSRVDAPDKLPEPVGMGWKQWLGLAWALGAGWGLARCVWGVTGAGWLIRTSQPVMTGEWLVMMEEVKGRLGMGGRLMLALSGHVVVPTVAGFLRPVVLIPDFAAPGLTGEELRLILAHELAHVRRHDLWVGLFQAVVEALLFFNPALRWISRQASLERECCCDQDATAVCEGDAAAYAALLGKWLSQEASGPGRMSVALALDGAGKGGSPVLERVARVLFPGRRVARRAPVWALATGVAAFLLLGLGTGAAAKAIVNAMTPQERVEILAKAQPKPLEGRANSAHRAVTKLVVKVKAAPGKEIGPGGRVWVYHIDRRYNAVSGDSEEVALDRSATFLGIWDMTRIWGMRVGMVEPLTGVTATEMVNLKEDQLDRTVEIEVGKGKQRSVRVTNEKGDPVAGADVAAAILFENKATEEPAGQRLGKTDAAGRLDFSVDSPYPVLVSVFADGAGPASVRLDPQGSQESKVIVRAAKPTTGRVVSGKTGQPMAHARVEAKGAPYTATTDADGRFELQGLQPGRRYLLLADYGSGYAENVEAGTDVGDVRAGEVIIRGRVIDPQGLLLSGRGTLYCLIRGGSSSTRVLEMKKGEGAQVHFVTRSAKPGNLRLQCVGEGRNWILYDQPLTPGKDEDLVLDLGKAMGPRAEQWPVTFKITVPEGEPVPVGVLMLSPALDGTGEIRFEAQDKGVKTVMLPAFIRYSYDSSTRFPGFRLGRAPDFKLEEGTVHKEVNVELMPAGAVLGKVTNADGSPCTFFKVRVFHVTPKGDWRNEEELPLRQQEREQGRFVWHELEMGVTYGLKVTVQGRDGKDVEHVIGPYTITRERPVREVNLVAR